jgi:hypothetical protein
MSCDQEPKKVGPGRDRKAENNAIRILKRNRDEMKPHKTFEKHGELLKIPLPQAHPKADKEGYGSTFFSADRCWLARGRPGESWLGLSVQRRHYSNASVVHDDGEKMCSLQQAFAGSGMPGRRRV